MQTQQLHFGSDQATITLTLKHRCDEETARNGDEEIVQMADDTGVVIWPCAKLLCDYLSTSLCQNKKIIEIGSGVGCCGILAAKLGASKVVLTDSEPFVVANLNENISLNGVDFNCCACQLVLQDELKYCKDSMPPVSFDVMLASDILFLDKMGPLVIAAFLHFCEQRDGILLLAHEQRHCMYLDECKNPKKERRDSALENFIGCAMKTGLMVSIVKGSIGNEGDLMVLMIGRHVDDGKAKIQIESMCPFEKGQIRQVTLDEDVAGKVIQVVGGSNYKNILTDHGNVYTWEEDCPVIPVKFPSFDIHVTNICCGWAHSLCVTDQGFVYSWGFNRFGQLGHGDTEKLKFPKKIQFFDGIKDNRAFKVAAGEHHSVVIGQTSGAWSFGLNQNGRLGLPNDDVVVVTSPRMIETLSNVKLLDIGCGWSHNLAYSEAKDVWVWGWNQYGQLGTGDLVDVTIPQSLDMMKGEDIRCVCGGGWHSIVVSATGAVYFMGWGAYGQISSFSSATVPTMMESTLDFMAAACGARHSVLLTENRHVLLLGWGYTCPADILLLSHEISSTAPLVLQGEFDAVGCGSDTVVLVSKEKINE